MYDRFQDYKFPVFKGSIHAALLASCVSLGVFSSIPAFASEDEKSNKYFAEAVEEYKQGNAPEAIIQLRNAIQQDPSNMDARFLLGKMHLQAKNIDSAIKELELVHEKRQNDEVELALGQAYFEGGRYDKALKIVSTDALTSEMVVEKQIVRGDTFLAKQKYDQAEQAFKKAVSIDGSSKKALYGLARTLVIEGELSSATEIMEKITAVDSSFVPVWMLQGEIALSKGNKSEALNAFNKAVELEPENVDAYISRARAYLTMGELDKALDDSNQIARLTPRNPITKYLSASAHYAKGDYDAAAADYNHIRERYRSFPPAVLLGALISYKQGNLGQSESLLMRYLNIEPDSSEAKRILALVRIQSNDYRGGIKALEQLVRDDPDDITSLQLLASAHLELEDFGSATQAYQQIVERGNPAFARQADTALKLLSDTEGKDGGLGPNILLVLNYINSDQLDDAEEVISKIKASHPDNPVVSNLEGGVLLAQKNYKEARRIFEGVLEKDPAFLSAIDNLDRIDYIEGAADNVEKRLDQLLTKAPNSEALIIRKAQFLSNNNRLEDASALLAAKKDSVERPQFLLHALVKTYFGLNQPEAAGNSAEELALLSEEANHLAFAIDALIDSGMPAKSVTAAQKLLKLNQSSPQAHMMLAKAYVANQNFEMAEETLIKAFAENPSNSVIARGLVDIALGTGDEEKAFSVIEQFSKTNPDLAVRLKANTHLKLEKPDMAVSILKQKMNDDPSEDVVVDLFIANRAAGNINDALDTLEQWIASNPKSRRALTAYAGTLLDMKKLKEADIAYRKLIDLDPNNAVALNNYAWIRNEMGKPDALDYAEKAYKRASASPEIADTYGWLLVQNGKLKDGLEILRAAAGRSPNNPDILYHLAYTLAKTGQNDDAISILQVLLDKAGDFAGREKAAELYESLT